MQISYQPQSHIKEGDITCQFLPGVKVQAAGRAAVKAVVLVKEEAAVAVSAAAPEDFASVRPAATRRHTNRASRVSR
ncbi:MAG: hypothetical protein WCD80_15755 [Desulfobaccales bacterium]